MPQGGNRPPGREVMAMNILGEMWLSYLEGKIAPNEWPVKPLDAYMAFGGWLWREAIREPRIDNFGGVKAEGWEIEMFRRTLPRFEIFQRWWYWKREEVKQRKDKVVTRCLGENLGLVSESG